LGKSVLFGVFLTFDATAKMNSFAKIIYQYNSGLGNKKTDIIEWKLQMSVLWT